MGTSSAPANSWDEWNPLTHELASAKKELTKLRSRRTRLSSAIERHDLVDMRPVRDRHATLEASARENTAQSQVLDGQIKLADDDVATAERDLETCKRFSRQRRTARKNLSELRRARNKLIRQKSRGDKAKNKIADDLEAVETQLTTYTEFDRTAKVRQLDELSTEIERRRVELDELRARKKRLDTKLAPLVDELSRLQEQEAHAQRQSDALDNIIDDYRTRLATARSLMQKLDLAGTSYERKLIHEDSEALLGTGRPGPIAHDARARINECEHEQRQLQKQRERITRNIQKLVHRIKVEARKESRLIERLVIDGSNLCYQSDNTFIGLRALRPLSAELVQRWTVTVVFDASIRSLLRTNDEGIRAQFPGAEVHVVATGEKADEVILRLADQTTTHIVSNDRYTDFPDYPAARDHRVIRHEILRGVKSLVVV